MARIKGLVNCSVNFEVNKTAPLDSRTVVDTVLELTELNTWADESGKVWLYDGLVVAVKENNGLYMLTGQDEDPTAYSDSNNWHKIDATTVVDNLTSTDNTKALAASQGKVLSDKIDNLKTSLSSVYNYKGSKNTFADLPTDAAIGDVWNVVTANGNIPAGTNYAWTGESWDALGGSVDLSAYSTTEEVNELINAAKPTSELTQLREDVNANTTALTLINDPNPTKEGSLANTLQTAKDYTDTQLDNYVEKVTGSSLITTEKLQLIDENASNITALDGRIEKLEAKFTGDVNTEGSVLNIVNKQISNALDWHEIE